MQSYIPIISSVSLLEIKSYEHKLEKSSVTQLIGEER